MPNILKTAPLFPGRSTSCGTSHSTFQNSKQANARLIVAVMTMSATLALAADAAAAGPFDAQSTQYVETIRFRIADLHTPEGARRLARRIRNAAAYVCDGDDPVVRTSSGFETCRTASIRRAISGVSAPLLAQALNIAPGDAHAGQAASAEARPD